MKNDSPVVLGHPLPDEKKQSWPEEEKEEDSEEEFKEYFRKMGSDQ